MQQNALAWLDLSTLHDWVARFPLPVALMDEAGGPLILNDRFSDLYGEAALVAPDLQALLNDPPAGWTTIAAPGARDGRQVLAQVVRGRGFQTLILDDMAEPALLSTLEALRTRVETLERRSAIDPLTGAWNRGHFDGVIVSEMDRSLRFRQPVTLIMLDVDHFKQVNDSCGHLAGDGVLRDLVQLVAAAVRSSDTLFRWGGDEFVILAPQTNRRHGAVMAAKVAAEVEAYEFTGVGRVKISLGVAEYVAGESQEIWFRRADEALYQAKTSAAGVTVDPRGASDEWAAEDGGAPVRLIWREAYECGEPTIDSQHRTLFEMGNALFDAAAREGATAESLVAPLDALLAHLARHFGDEEAILAVRGYGDLRAHKRAHASLLARATNLKAAVASGGATLGDLVDFLVNAVIARHLFRGDRQFFPLFDSAPDAARGPPGRVRPPEAPQY